VRSGNHNKVTGRLKEIIAAFKQKMMGYGARSLRLRRARRRVKVAKYESRCDRQVAIDGKAAEERAPALS
jgi:hypothetical protein